MWYRREEAEGNYFSMYLNNRLNLTVLKIVLFILFEGQGRRENLPFHSSLSTDPTLDLARAESYQSQELGAESRSARGKTADPTP